MKKLMLEFKLPAMTCGHCATSVTQACHEVDPGARVEVNLDTKQVLVETAQDRAAFAEALTEAGYPPLS
jgi:copper chaperone